MSARDSRQLVWDLPTRAFHWLLVVLLGFSWWSAENHAMEWHYRSGLAICFLAVFRLCWGLIGPRSARFAQFAKGPRQVWRHLRSTEARVLPGHSPLGGWSVMAMLGLVSLQVLLGLFAVDVDGIESGPLSYLVSFDQGRLAAEYHELVFNILAAIIALHIGAVLFYLLVRRRNLVTAMITGYEPAPGVGAEPMRPAPPWRLALALLVAASVTYLVANGLSVEQTAAS
jgi:cytochrome b